MRPYYDHEPAYRRIAETGGAGWDDLPTAVHDGCASYLALDGFLASSLAVPGAALDLGCGGGQVSLELAARGYRVVGVDFAPTAIALARRNAPGLTFVVGDCLALELPTASFDLAVDNHVLHCILGGDRARFLREVARVVRPGGLLFSDTMSREGHVDYDRHEIDRLLDRLFWLSATSEVICGAPQVDQAALYLLGARRIHAHARVSHSDRLRASTFLAGEAVPLE